MLVKKSKLAISLVMAFALGGCGGGGSSATVEKTAAVKPKPVAAKPDPVKKTTIALTGKVIDGYVSGATVWLDINGDGSLNEESEPSVVSTESGDYSFNFTQEQALCVPYSTMYVDVPVGAMDEDLGEVTEAYQMSFPPSIEVLTGEDIRNISPLTTVIWEQLSLQLQKSGNNNLSCDALKENIELLANLQSEITNVMQNLVAHYNLSTEQIYSDFIANNDSEAYDRAQAIVKGLKAAYKYKQELDAQFPDAEEVRAVIYQDTAKDDEYGFENAWYRDKVIFAGAEFFYEQVKLQNTDALDKIDFILTQLQSIDTPWGEESLNGKLRIRDDVYINADRTYRCSSIEKVSFENSNVLYSVDNTSPSVNFPTADECVSSNLDTPFERGFSISYTESGAFYQTDFAFREENADFQTLSNWVNVKDKAADLDTQDLVTVLAAMPYKFDDETSIDASFWRKYKTTDNVRISKTIEGQWVRDTRREDGTMLHECSDNGADWTACN
ncbi:hypothetical protein [Pseudoalteromonas aliena]|uniref:Lipoprotein n=1 Tax=Pseudoalteromonas aliena SW19 TaxID=1314866 RepID=A0ABR9DYH5_9GAMM|nr:hypothetical protein [Pseudoalteromonas aliena]MBE0359419.1 hypothetical protein [Pseudoalteromonas aliena SW19]